MNNPSTPAAPPLVEEPDAPHTSPGAKLVNIFVCPGEVFDEVKQRSHNHLNWLLPTLFSLAMGVVFVFVVFSQDTVFQEMRDQTEKAVEKKVAQGKLTRQEADQRLAVTERFVTPTIVKISGSVGATIVIIGWLFGVSLVVWGIGCLALKGQFGYLKALEVCGLSGMVEVLGALVTMLIVVAMGSIYMNPGPVLLLREFDPANVRHLGLASFNLVTFWYIGLLALGLSRLAGCSWLRAAAWLFGTWALWTIGRLAVSALMQNL